MNHRITTAALLFGTLLLAGRVYADCPGPFLHEIKRAYENAKTADSKGRKEDALYFYHAAESDVCEGPSPYGPEAAKRAAALGLELGTAAENASDFEKAQRLYDAGGHFAAADRAFMQTVRAEPDKPGSYTGALGHFDTRSQDWFAASNAVAMKVTGAYKQDPKFFAELNAMPPKAIERATQKEATSFNEEYLRDFVQVSQARPDDATEAGAIQRMISAQQAFAKKWPTEDLVKVSRESLQNLRDWGEAVQKQDPKLAATVAAKVAQLSEQRATTLRQKYFGAPKLLEDAKEYYRVPPRENSKADVQIAAVRTQALKLGDEANSKSRWVLAADYYGVADADDKADAVREHARQLAMQKMQPAIDEAQKQAEAMRKQFSDPAKVAEMQAQARAAQKAMQEQQASSKAGNKKAAADLEKELGL